MAHCGVRSLVNWRNSSSRRSAKTRATSMGSTSCGAVPYRGCRRAAARRGHAKSCRSEFFRPRAAARPPAKTRRVCPRVAKPGVLPAWWPTRRRLTASTNAHGFEAQAEGRVQTCVFESYRNRRQGRRNDAAGAAKKSRFGPTHSRVKSLATFVSPGRSTHSRRDAHIAPDNCASIGSFRCSPRRCPSRAPGRTAAGASRRYAFAKAVIARVMAATVAATERMAVMAFMGLPRIYYVFRRGGPVRGPACDKVTHGPR